MKKKTERQASIYFKYPELRRLKTMTPKERTLFIEKKFQGYYRSVVTKLAGHDFELIGSKKKPRGVKVKYDNKLINSLVRLKFVDGSLSTGLGKRRNRTKRSVEEPYYCFKVIFQIQIEGKTKGLQTYEERYILVKADSWKNAEVKVNKMCRNNEEPYLNTYGQLVRWKFESIEESYHTFIGDKDDFDNPVEVFSKLRTRQLKKENIWDGQ